MAIKSVFGSRESRERKTLPNREYYKTLLGNKKDATFLADTDGDLFLLNQPARLLSGYQDEEIREYNVRDLFVTLKTVDNPFDTRQLSEFTAKLFLIDSQRYLHPVLFDFKEIEGQKFLGTCVEITEQEPAAAPPEHARPAEPQPPVMAPPGPASDKLPRWAADFEHNVRNLLNSILGFGALLSGESSVKENKKLAGTVDSLLKSGNRLKKILNQVTFGEEDLPEVNRAPCLLAPILQKAGIILEPLARKNDLSIHIKPVPEILVFTDEELLIELLKFLITKAATYTRGDAVLLEASEDAPGRQAIVLIDNIGQDIPQSMIHFINRENQKERYDLTNPVALQNPEIASMLHILNRIGGKISFTTGPSMGEIVRIMLPLLARGENPDDLTRLEESIRKKKPDILIVEDEKFTARILAMFLENIAEVTTAYSGNEALNIIELRYNKGTLFSLVIMDIGLPIPWDGILLKTEIEKRWPGYQNVPFLAQTAYTSRSYNDRIQEHHFAGHLIKPINREDLLRLIDQST
ncbi:MAG: response regulator [Bacteroidales bacterium]|nr:response regulator [Bacteroidales bacterium]HNW73952.1 response regulator [Bacteroidales bacterium]HPS50628.1 response regulator [Bacteroidales bacterium]